MVMPIRNANDHDNLESKINRSPPRKLPLGMVIAGLFIGSYLIYDGSASHSESRQFAGITYLAFASVLVIADYSDRRNRHRH